MLRTSAVAVGAMTMRGAAAQNPPNILLLMTDQQRFDSLGCYGFTASHTPNLDRLASEGVVFDQHYVTNPLCTPSRACTMTGKHVTGHGVLRLNDNLPSDEVLFTKRLQTLGYATALFGKLHVSSMNREAEARHPNGGFDIYEWCNEGCVAMDSPFQAYSTWLKERNPTLHAEMVQKGRGVGHLAGEFHNTHWAAERTIDFIKNHDGTKPFFAKMSIFDPHNPYDAYPPEAEQLVNAAAIPDPIIRENEFEGKPKDLYRENQFCHLGNVDAHSLDDFRKIRHGYHIAVAFADLEFGRVLQALEDKGIADNTLVIFTSDHGDMLGDHRLLAKGAFFYDPCTRTPLLMRWPKALKRGHRASGLVQNIDLTATVLSAAGMDADEIHTQMPDARDLLPMARGETDSVREDAICTYRNSGLCAEKPQRGYFDPPINATMLRHGRYKLNLWHSSGPLEGELYDMEADPQELNNLWASPEHAATRKELTARLVAWGEAHGDPIV